MTSTTQRTRWAILGPGAISRDFLAGLRASAHGALTAVGSSDPDRAARFAAEAGAEFSGTYDEVLARDDVDAVYIGTVHPLHADTAVRALEAGKAVLCEKPAAPSADEVERILAAAERSGRPFVEAYKNRFGPWAETLRTLLRSGELGAPLEVEAGFGSDAPTRTGRLFDPALAGGAILDVGCYTVSLAVEAAYAQASPPAADIVLQAASGEVMSGVDGEASARLRLGRMDASLRTAVIRDLPRSARIRCEGGDIELPDAWGERHVSSTRIVVRPADAAPRTLELPPVEPMAAEADAVTAVFAAGELEAPEVPWQHTRAIAQVLTAWRSAVVPDAASDGR